MAIWGAVSLAGRAIGKAYRQPAVRTVLDIAVFPTSIKGLIENYYFDQAYDHLFDKDKVERTEDMNEIIAEIDTVQVAAMKQAALFIMFQLVSDSPVDTGWFRANWIISTYGRDAQVRNIVHKDGRVDAASVAKAVTLQQEGLLALKTLQEAKTIKITNHVPYAARLAEGYSPQASAGWIRRAIRTALEEAEISGDIIER